MGSLQIMSRRTQIEYLLREGGLTKERDDNVGSKKAKEIIGKEKKREQRQIALGDRMRNSQNNAAGGTSPSGEKKFEAED